MESQGCFTDCIECDAFGASIVFFMLLLHILMKTFHLQDFLPSHLYHLTCLWALPPEAQLTGYTQ